MERDSKGRFKSPEQKVYAEGYKGFEKDFSCRGFKYAVGKVFKTAKAVLCREGFHFSTNAFDVLDYYRPCDGSVYAEVQSLAPIHMDAELAKVVTTKLKIVKKLSLLELLHSFFKSAKVHDRYSAEAVAFTEEPYEGATTENAFSVAAGMKDHSGAESLEANSAAVVTGFSSIAHAAGDRSAAVSTYGHSAAIASGCRSAAVVTSNRGLAEVHRWDSVALVLAPHSVAYAKYPGSVAMTNSQGSYVKGVKGAFLIAPEWGYDKGGALIIKTFKCVKVDGEKIKENIEYMYEGRMWVPYDKIQ